MEYLDRVRAVGNEKVAGEVFNVVDFYNAQADYHRLAAEVAGVPVVINREGWGTRSTVDHQFGESASSSAGGPGTTFMSMCYDGITRTTCICG